MPRPGVQLAATWAATTGTARRLIPQATAGWGVLAVAAAFAFLGVGATLSLRKQVEVDAPLAPEAETPTPGG